MNAPAAPRAFIIGHPVAHARSPLLHRYWLRSLGLAGSYEAVDVPPERLGPFFATLRAQGFAGGNVTVPHKSAVIPFLTRIDEAAQAVGAVNTIWWERDELVGGNTDAPGFLANLDSCAPGWDGARTALVLGAGGAAPAVTPAQRPPGLVVQLANRTTARAEALVRHFGAGTHAHAWQALPALLERAELLVNTTALGMQGKPPLAIDLGPLRRSALVCDAVYVPLETALLGDARARGHRTVDGLGMLLQQAVPGFRHWFAATPGITAELRSLIEADIEARPA